MHVLFSPYLLQPVHVSDKIEGWDYFPKKKQLVPDPEKNDLMHKFIDKYAELISEDFQAKTGFKKPEKKPLEEHKLRRSHFAAQEESYNVLETIHASQNKQRQQKQTNYIIDDPGDIRPENNEREEICEDDFVKGREKYSQSVIVPMCTTESFVGREKVTSKKSLKRTAHRRMESRSFDASSIKQIMSIDLESVDKVGYKPGPKKK
eukprot:TRINITY_DN106553_c0_g1_i1.p2 TRINITY_DN106553_c0_g1~~TRINITY_DN106553_c0_g1_i1.p2  ORF type:complete len:206 (+),score=26.18 TRINITY_DN106553_c0_g1_i1:1103-1720(+)